MKVIKQKNFSNGVVYCLECEDGARIETTDTFLPYKTKSMDYSENTEKATREDRWMIGVSTMSGCPVHCKFCATGLMKKCRNLTCNEITDQILFVLKSNEVNPYVANEFKINYTRMGEPFLNIDAVKNTIAYVKKWINPGTHHYVSTIGIKDSDFSWIKDNITLQISLHSLDESRRNELIPYKNKMTIKELGQIRTKSNLKTTVNLTLVDESDFSIEKLKDHFDPKYFFIKLSPINENKVSTKNNLGPGIIRGIYE